ncbi:MAG: UbiD family decarboxylase domain-containing protein [Pseudomonadota bacterium]
MINPRFTSVQVTPLVASLRDFIARLKQENSLLVVQREVEPRFELNAVVRKIQAGPNLPVLFEHVRGTRFPVVSNTLGNYRILARLLNVDIGDVAATWAALTTTTAAPISDAHPDADPEWQEIPFTDVPHITFSEKDAGPYLTASAIVARDPDSGIVNLSYHRMQMVGPTELRCRLSTSGDLYRIQQKQGKARRAATGGGCDRSAAERHAGGRQHDRAGPERI